MKLLYERNRFKSKKNYDNFVNQIYIILIEIYDFNICIYRNDGILHI